ncbi:ARM repeat-containing protein [Basidiobolus meristosporus CBS 931.73]|uniref:ARM repeat-containing protein n=1 Tax=Basidiobolus meristosporus CBS 931.73 TaxID=1314790 RepID=A0A1Y1XXY7_9FUNG|nr:ARM repeat-containing protein [Basidiobolus meristosporus CBS 931.73]|eukprot:ORX90611.1 ARM repeat-containing protein [Basidiobolus meristosporus CBS 931.73]
MSFMLDEVEEVSLPQLERVAKLILSVPHQISSLQEYYKIIIPQLLSLIQYKFADVHSKAPESKERNQPKLVYRLFVGDLMKPITNWWSSQTEIMSEAEKSLDKLFENDEDVVLSSEDIIELTIATVHRLLVGNEPSPILFHCILSDAITPLYYLYEFAHTNKSTMKDQILEILQAYFRIMETDKGLEKLKSIVYRTRLGLKVMTVHKGYTYFTSGPSNGIVLARTNKPKEMDLNTELFVEFLNSMNNTELNGDFFIWALTQYSSAHTNPSMSNPRQTLVILHLILIMTESLGHTILKKSTQIIAFANSVLEKEDEPEIKNMQQNSKLEFLSNIAEEPEENEQDQSEIEYLALSLLGSVLTDDKELSTQDLLLLDHTQSLLARFSNHANSEIRNIANNLKLVIATRVAFNLNQQTTGEDKLAASRKRYQQAMEALQDQILPVKAYGIGILKDMVLKKDPLIVGPELDRVLDIFVSMVQNEDSFIYLNAIKGLSAMTDIHGKKILTKLLDIYEDKVNQPMDNRLRVGEALLQTVERAGEVLGKFADILLTSLLRVLRSRESPHLQNSALAIIGVMCETCPYALLPWFREIIEWMVTLLKLEKSVEVRRAAVVLFASLFRGMGVNAIYDIPSDLLKDILHTLRFVEATEQDELTKYHARIGLSDLDAIMKNEIFRS